MTNVIWASHTRSPTRDDYTEHKVTSVWERERERAQERRLELLLEGERNEKAGMRREG